MEETKETWLSCQWVLVASVEFLCECFALENFNQAVCLPGVSINVLEAVSTVSLGKKRRTAKVAGLLCKSWTEQELKISVDMFEN